MGFFDPQPYGDDVTPQKINTRRKLAQSLIEQSMQQEKPQMVGGIYVRPSGFDQIARGLLGYLGQKELEGADTAEKKLADALRGKKAAELQQFNQLLTGRPAYTLPEDQQGPVMPAVKPDINAAFEGLAKSESPELAQFGMQGILQTAQTKVKNDEAEQQRVRMGKIWEAAGGNPQKAIQMGMPLDMAKSMAEAPQYGKNKLVAVNGQMVDSITGLPVGNVIPKQEEKSQAVKNYEYARNQGYKGSFEEFEKSLRKSGASNISMNMAGTNEYMKKIGGSLAEANMATVEAAQVAPQQIQTAQAIRSALQKGAITGTGADMRLSLQRAMETAGLVGEGRAASTEELVSTLSNVTLTGIKSSGLGAGNGFTNSDRDFLESAKSGKISNTPQNLQRVADLLERQARASHQQGTRILQRWQTDPSYQGFAQDFQIQPLPTTTSTNGLPSQDAIAAEIARRRGK